MKTLRIKHKNGVREYRFSSNGVILERPKKKIEKMVWNSMVDSLHERMAGAVALKINIDLKAPITIFSR